MEILFYAWYIILLKADHIPDSAPNLSKVCGSRSTTLVRMKFSINAKFKKKKKDLGI